MKKAKKYSPHLFCRGIVLTPLFIQNLTASKQLKWKVLAIGENGKELETAKLIEIEK